ncbi:MAG: hypothetical protein JW891_12890 [Candidatus Lokiarchaeota archaeon]|nr:hypothetical protein [Candidatus Lokiarchaeota archaeon]
MTIKKRFHQEWIFECPEAVLTCCAVKCEEDIYLCFGGHDKYFYLMDLDVNILDDISFDGWCRCSHPIDITADGCEEILVGSGDGSFVVLKIDKPNRKLFGLKHYKSSAKIICCTAGNLYSDGDISLVIGCEDKTLKIFKNLSSEVPDIVLYYNSWVTSVCAGFLKLTEEKNQVFGLLVGTKKGLLQFVRIEDAVPNIVWQAKLFSQINEIKVGDVSNDGYNEIITCTDDSHVKILNGDGKKLRYIPIRNSRPISALIEDIDGDNSRELLIGCADGSLRVFENFKLDSHDFSLKWKSKMKSSIKTITSYTDSKDGKKHIVFGGYDRTLRNVYDFEVGKKPFLNIPERKKPHIHLKKKSIDNKNPPLVIATNIRDHIIAILNELKETPLLDLVKQRLIKIGYSIQEIDEEIKALKFENLLRFKTIDLPVYEKKEEKEDKKDIVHDIESIGEISNNENVNEDLVYQEPPLISKSRKVLYNESKNNLINDNLKNDILDYLNQLKIIPSKIDFIEAIAKKGHDKDKIEQKINSLKENGVIKYSRGSPRGWSLNDQ